MFGRCKRKENDESLENEDIICRKPSLAWRTLLFLRWMFFFVRFKIVVTVWVCFPNSHQYPRPRVSRLTLVGSHPNFIQALYRNSLRRTDVPRVAARMRCWGFSRVIVCEWLCACHVLHARAFDNIVAWATCMLQRSLVCGSGFLVLLSQGYAFSVTLKNAARVYTTKPCVSQ